MLERGHSFVDVLLLSGRVRAELGGRADTAVGGKRTLKVAEHAHRRRETRSLVLEDGSTSQHVVVGRVESHQAGYRANDVGARPSHFGSSGIRPGMYGREESLGGGFVLGDVPRPIAHRLVLFQELDELS